LHIRLLKKRFGEWKRTVSSLLRTKREPEKRRFAADFKFLLMAKVIQNYIVKLTLKREREYYPI
jgi:hypothetical protein